MTSDLDGDDPEYDLEVEEKNALEAALRERALEFLRNGKTKERRKALARAVEISRRKSRRAHQR
jgi:hypothetical protein